MAEIPPPPDKLPDGFSLQDDKKTVSLEEHYKRLLSLTEEIRETYQKILDQRDRLLEDVRRMEKFMASWPRIMLFSALGAVMGLAVYHLALILSTLFFN